MADDELKNDPVNSEKYPNSQGGGLLALLELRIESRDGAILKVPIRQEGQFYIGRAPSNNIACPWDLKISREHGELIVGSDMVFIRRLSKENPIWVNGELIQQKPRALKNGDVIRLGDTEISCDFKSPVLLSDSKIGEEKKRIAPAPSPSKEILRPTVKNDAVKDEPIRPLATKSTGANSAAVSRGLGTATSNRLQGRSESAEKNRNLPFWASMDKNEKILWLLLAGVLGFLIYFILDTKPSLKVQRQIVIKNPVLSRQEIQESERRLAEVEGTATDSRAESLQKSADIYFKLGNRDFLTGNYLVALDQFRLALSLRPQDDEIRKMILQTLRKLEAMGSRHYELGRRYLASKNYRLCRNQLEIALTYLQNKDSDIYRETQQFLEECKRLYARNLSEVK